MTRFFYTCFLLLCTAGTGTTADADEPVFISIIIDDLGYSLKNGLRAVHLPGEITYSVLPYTRHSKSLARKANDAGKEVMLHLPMENVRNQDIGPNGLMSGQKKTEFIINLNKALADVPFVSGVNNHMGSYLTQQTRQMSWLMDEMRSRHIFFIDSRTTPDSVASLVAQQKHVTESSRDIFLDNNPTFFEIDRSFRHLIRIARRRGSAIAIGHPNTTTLAYLEIALPMLDEIGVSLVSASELLRQRSFTANTQVMVDKTELDTVNSDVETSGIAE